MVVVLKQRFEFGTMGAREAGYQTHHVETYARDAGFHAHRHPPGCNRADDSSLAFFFKSAKQDKLEDTRGHPSILFKLGLILFVRSNL